MSLSPDGRYKAVLEYEGEVRFGPSYCRLELNGKPLSGRIFGEVLCWSDDSRYLALQEWLSTDYGKGPVTRVLLIALAIILIWSMKLNFFCRISISIHYPLLPGSRLSG